MVAVRVRGDGGRSWECGRKSLVTMLAGARIGDYAFSEGRMRGDFGEGASRERGWESEREVKKWRGEKGF